MYNSASKLAEKCLAESYIHQLWESIYRSDKNEQFYEQAFDHIIRVLNAPKNSVFLDAGCGKESVIGKYKSEAKLAVGVDISWENLRNNPAFHYLEVADLEKLPFKDETFDVILSQYVAEHLSDPEAAFQELYRVLKGDGVVIISTNSIFNPVMFMSALLPLSVRSKIKARVWDQETGEDTFPTYYRCNSLRRINMLLQRVGFKKEFDTYAGFPYCVALSKYPKILLTLMFLFEKLTDLKWLRF